MQYFSLSAGKMVDDSQVPFKPVEGTSKPSSFTDPTWGQKYDYQKDFEEKETKKESIAALYEEIKRDPSKLSKVTGDDLSALSLYAKDKGGLPSVQSSQDETKAGVMKDAETALKELEDLYLNGPDGPLALSKTGDLLRLGGRVESLKANQIAGENPQLKTYMAQMKTMGPKLAKLAGDTGNIALQEQLKALEGLPKPTDTIEEALMTINSTRKKFGLPERDLSAFQGDSSSNNVSKGVVSTGTQQQESGFENRIPDLPYKGLSALLSLFQKNPLTSAITGAVGQGLGDVSFAAQQVGKPVSDMTSETKDRLEQMSRPGYATQPAKAAAQFGVGKMAQNALGFLLGGVKSAKSLAGVQPTTTNVLSKVLGLPGANLATAVPVQADITSIAPKAAELMKQRVTGQTVTEFEKYLPKIAKVYSGGKMDLPTLIKKAGELSGAWKSGVGNEVKDAAVNSARAIERQAVREVISKQGPLYDILYKSAAGQRVTKEMIKKIWWLVPSLGAAVWGVGQVKEGLQGGQ